RYSTVGQSNVTIVTVHAASEDLADEAADVLDDCGAIDVDEHAGQAGYTGSNTRSEGIGGTLENAGNSISGAIDNLGDRLRGENRGSRSRSRIIDRSVDDDYRLRDL
ncbi:MAG TPA: hypothetical protein VHK69_07465, partial [Chitinophagaceae bacterium]|nr:hypothetical protein [Chitinophagaceae bacterium]